MPRAKRAPPQPKTSIDLLEPAATDVDVRKLLNEVLSEQQEAGNWVSDGNRDWDIVMSATMLRALSAWGLPREATWFASDTPSGQGGVRLALDFFDRTLDAKVTGIAGADAWDTCQLLLARAAFDVTPRVKIWAKRTASQWTKLCAQGSDPPNRWMGPAFHATMIDVLMLFEKESWAQDELKEKCKLLRTSFAIPSPASVAPVAPFPAETGWENEHRWNSALVLRTLGLYREIVMVHWPEVDEAIKSTASWLCDELKNCGRWIYAREAEGPMFTARALDGLRAAYPHLDAADRLRSKEAFRIGDMHLRDAIEDGVPNLKSKTAILAYWANARSTSDQAAFSLQESLDQLSPKEQIHARELRENLWSRVHAEIGEYLEEKGSASRNSPWYAAFSHLNGDRSETVQVFPCLPALGNIFVGEATIEPEAYIGEFYFDREKKRWHLNDAIVLGFDKDRTQEQKILAAELFLLHEYVHIHHRLTGDTAQGIGRFPNVLEYVDYMSDAYAILHALDRRQVAEKKQRTEQAAIRLVTGIVDVMIRSFWAFERDGQQVWEIRRIRRHLNWYWRREQMSRCKHLWQVLALLARKPQVELAGFAHNINGRRVQVNLGRHDQSTGLQIALVLENDEIFRRPSGEDASLDKLLVQGIVGRDHDLIKSYFRAIGDLVPSAGLLPHAPL